MADQNKLENSIVKKYRNQIWLRFIKGIREYQLIRENDRIAVCISGGKDSMLLAKCMQRLQKYSKFPFGLEFLVMDPGYNSVNRQRIEANAEMLDIPIKIFETDIFNIVAKSERYPCYLCAKMRRGYLYENARRLGCNKIALGHHFDDVIETTLMSMLYGAEIRTMMPKLHSEHFPGMELIRPLYMVHEADIIAWRNYNELRFIQCACRFTEKCAIEGNEGASKRLEMKALINQFRKINPNIDKNIFTSTQNIDLDSIIGYRTGGARHSFLDDYDGDACFCDDTAEE